MMFMTTNDNAEEIMEEMVVASTGGYFNSRT